MPDPGETPVAIGESLHVVRRYAAIPPMIEELIDRVVAGQPIALRVDVLRDFTAGQLVHLLTVMLDSPVVEDVRIIDRSV